MKLFPRLLCLATLATAAFAQTPSFVTADPGLANDSQAATTQAADSQIIDSKAQASNAPSNNAGLQRRSPLADVAFPTATVLRLKLDRSISTASAHPGEQFTATLSQPVEVKGRTLIPAGATVNCAIKRALGARRRPLLSIKALSIRMPDGVQFNFSASVVDTNNPREFDVDEEGALRGNSHDPMTKVEVGALAGVGAIAGAIIAGPEGLLIGSASGVMLAAGHILMKPHELTVPAGTELIFELDAPASMSRPPMGGMQ
jgi:hypothetical protein